MPCLCPFSLQARNRKANNSRHKFPPRKEPALHEPFCMSSNHDCPIARHITSHPPIEQVFCAIQRRNSPFRKISCQHESQLCIANPLGRNTKPSYPFRPSCECNLPLVFSHRKRSDITYLCQDFSYVIQAKISARSKNMAMIAHVSAPVKSRSSAHLPSHRLPFRHSSPIDASAVNVFLIT